MRALPLRGCRLNIVSTINDIFLPFCAGGDGALAGGGGVLTKNNLPRFHGSALKHPRWSFHSLYGEFPKLVNYCVTPNSF